MLPVTVFPMINASMNRLIIVLTEGVTIVAKFVVDSTHYQIMGK